VFGEKTKTQLLGLLVELASHLVEEVGAGTGVRKGERSER
jgi:hypothetical protein